jgi:hypothetical protein
MATRCVAQASASATAATPPSTTHTKRRSGNHRRICCIICRTQSILVLCWRRSLGSAGQPSAVRHGNAPTRRLQGTDTHNIIATHRSPKQWMTCFLVERTASREQPLAAIFRPQRRSMVASAPSTIAAADGTSRGMSWPKSI